MNQRLQLIAEVRQSLSKASFATSDPKDLVHAGFDIVARKGATILIVKVLTNANSAGEDALTAMKSLAGAIGGCCLMVAARAGNDAVEDGVSYSRAGIPLISLGTLRDLVLEGVPPLVYAASGGFYVSLDSEILRRARDGGLSLGDMAEMAGVTRRTIKMYEEGMNAKMEVALRLEEGMGMELIVPQEPLRRQAPGNKIFSCQDVDGIAREIFQTLGEIGYSIMPVPRCPFDAITSDEHVTLFTGVDQKRPGLDRRARAMANLSRILEKHPVIFVDRLGERVNLEGTPLIGSGELRKAGDKKRVVELIEERY